MSFVSTKSLYHVALDGVGLILQGAPDQIAYRQTQAPVYGTRFASGDRDYNDLSQWWYFVQTDWSGGFKESVAWANDAKYYYAANIDTWSEIGTIQLSRKQTFVNEFAEDILCGLEVPPSAGALSTPFRTSGANGEFFPASFASFVTAWSNPSAINSSDDNRATCVNSNAYRTSWYDFQLNVPTNATVTGIEVRIECANQQQPNGPRRLQVHLCKNSQNTTETDFFGNGTRTTPDLGTSDSVNTLGGANDLWGGSWTPADFNTSIFGIKVSGTGGSSPTTTNYQIDHFQIKVHYSLPANTRAVYLGTFDGPDGKPAIYKRETNGTWTEKLKAVISTNENVVAHLSAPFGVLWAHMVGIVANENFRVATLAGETWTDQSVLIGNASGMNVTVTNSRAAASFSNAQYVFVDNPNEGYALVKTTVLAPTVAADYTVIFSRATVGEFVVAARAYGDSILYLVYQGGQCELRSLDTVTNVDVSIRQFKGVSLPTWGVGDKLIVELNGVAIITLPSDQIWAYNGSSIVRIWRKNTTKTSVDFNIADANISGGAVISDNKAVWSNMIYDGETFHAGWRDIADGSSSVIPIMVDGTENIYQVDQSNQKRLNTLRFYQGEFKGATANKNYLVFSNFDNIAGIDKLAYSATIIFRPLLSGQSISVDYHLGELSSVTPWISLGTASHAIDGGVVRDKTFFFGNSVIFKKVWFRVRMQSDGTNTPAMTDMVMEYLPMPAYKKLWQIRVNCGDQVKRVDGSNVEIRGRALRSRLENAWWTKSLMDFQDFDYVTTTVASSTGITATDTDIRVPNGATEDFPEQGRIRIDDEEILYTGRTNDTFTGCVRGARSTRAVTHAQGAVINNAYKVLITDLQAQVPVALEPENKALEYVVTLTLREA